MIRFTPQHNSVQVKMNSLLIAISLVFSMLWYTQTTHALYEEGVYASVKWNAIDNNYLVQNFESRSFADGVNPLHSVSQGSVAWGYLKNNINQTGWSHLEIYTNGSYDDLQQAYAAGAAEASVTKELISMQWTNTMKGTCTEPLSKDCKILQTYLDDNLSWVTKQLALYAEYDSYWHQVQLFMEQLAGLIDSYNGFTRFPSKYSMDVTGLAMLQISGDLEDLQSALKIHLWSRVMGSGSCSALIKLLPNNQDLYIAHDTWTGLGDMLRVMKKYDFKFSKTGGNRDDMIPGQVSSFSSSPGVLLSGDDFYVMNSGLVSIETTIGNNNPDLWKYVTPENAVLEGIRNLVANRLAVTGKQWAEIFSKYNSGTYNNEWMVLDYKLFKAGQDLPDEGVLYVLDQIPGMIVADDQTQTLKRKTYWPSYNNPFFPKIFNASGGPDMVKKFGNWFSHDHTPRANIFRRDHHAVRDIETMTKLMRYNDFKHDPFSKCACDPPYSGENAISSRCDLNPINGSYPFDTLGHRSHAGIDMKLTTSALVPTLDFIGIASPAYDDVPAFQWSTSSYRDTVSHVGHPDLWNFKAVQTKWRG